MLKELVGVNTTEELENVSVRLLDDSVFHQLQEEMVSDEIVLRRTDYWPEDILARKTANASALKRAVAEVAGEAADKKVLHLLQIVMVTAPGATSSIQRFLKRVTF